MRLAFTSCTNGICLLPSGCVMASKRHRIFEGGSPGVCHTPESSAVLRVSVIACGVAAEPREGETAVTCGCR